MSTVTQFPMQNNYDIYGIHRDGRIIVQILNSSQRFIMCAENIIANRKLIKQFPKEQVQWLCSIAASNIDDYQRQGA